jgi:hypothetical protein
VLRLRLALLLSFSLLTLRLHLASKLGFADAEALYACYALHPQPAYLDHPGLVGTVMRLLGAGGVPTAIVAHTAAAFAATLLPWLGALAARAAGASGEGSFRTLFALALVPELAVGLFSLTPDLLLAVLWLGALGAAALALRAEPGSSRALYGFLACGGLLGLGVLAKVSAALLAVALIGTLLTRAARPHLRTFGPWGALLLMTILVVPLLLWEATRGYPMLEHRFVSTQANAGVSLRNAAVLLGGQLLYVSPPALVAAVLIGRSLFRKRRDDITSTLLWNATWIPGLALSALCLWSRVAEPHWLAPAYLALALDLGRASPLPRRLAAVSLATGAVLCMLAWFWVGTDLPPQLLGRHYPDQDPTNDLYAWGPGKKLVLEVVEDTMREKQAPPVVVGPHYIVCAQAHAALGPGIPVGCNTPRRDDFDGWYPRQLWLEAPVVLYVRDERFGLDAPPELPNRVVRSVATVSVRRGDLVVRRLQVVRLDKLSETATR